MDGLGPRVNRLAQFDLTLWIAKVNHARAVETFGGFFGLALRTALRSVDPAAHIYLARLFVDQYALISASAGLHDLAAYGDRPDPG
jgi:hypothetical protein